MERLYDAFLKIHGKARCSECGAIKNLTDGCDNAAQEFLCSDCRPSERQRRIANHKGE